MLLKKILLCGVSALILSGTFLCGCKAQPKQPEQAEIPQSFETTAHVQYKELEATMRIYREPMNCAQVVFESPESMKGFKLIFYPDRTKLSYQDLSFEIAPDNLPGKAAAKMFLSAVSAALDKEGIRLEQREDKLCLRGQIDEGAFELTLDGKTGNILKLSIPQSELEMELLNFKILE